MVDLLRVLRFITQYFDLPVGSLSAFQAPNQLCNRFARDQRTQRASVRRTT
jgi:hypothetical protein